MKFVASLVEKNYKVIAVEKTQISSSKKRTMHKTHDSEVLSLSIVLARGIIYWLLA